jgi:phage terminase Nu1 subunit (DNA packaging protein)
MDIDNANQLMSSEDETTTKSRLTRKKNVLQQLKKIQFEMKLHKTKASTFYERKRQARRAAQISETIEAITMDFQKTYPCPT